eukprot:Selendium_serpulae@DN1586_c0_g1_i1.p1
MGGSIIFPKPSYSPCESSSDYLLLEDGDNPKFAARFWPAPSGGENYTLFYLHGNSCDLFQLQPELEVYRQQLNVNIFAVEYPGYGINQIFNPKTGPSAPGINRYARAGYRWLRRAQGVPSERIVVFGVSIGTGPATELAKWVRQEGGSLGGLALQAPYLSIDKLVVDYVKFGWLSSFLGNNKWDNEHNLQGVGDIPLLIIHGQIDTVIPFYHGKQLSDGYQGKHNLMFTEQFGHNDYQVIEHIVPQLDLLLRVVKKKNHAMNSMNYN